MKNHQELSHSGHFSTSAAILFLSVLTVLLISCKGYVYQGGPWGGKAQQIPGRVECELYDTGGEGIAYHDSDSINSGSGRLNPVNGDPLNEFRMNEAVDISYTKGNAIDNNPYNLVEPEPGKLYTGWTVPGEWINYSVTVRETDLYTLGIMYTASGDGKIRLSLDGKDLSGELLIPSTRTEAEELNWRQWHHWNRIDSLTSFWLEKGEHILRLETTANGNMNYDCLIFKNATK